MPFWELAIRSTAEASEGLTNFLWELGALGVVEEEEPGGAPRLRAFFPEMLSPTRLASAVSDYLGSLRALGFAVDGTEPRVTPLLDEPWAEAWRQAFAPRPVGRRLLIAPPWDLPPASDGRLTIIIEPGRAFGTGSHGSTQGCLLLLEALLDRHPVTHALDLGTGTGILAIAAAALGVPRVMALDTDPDALTAARANAARNGLGDRIDCRLGGVESAPDDPSALILANLLATAHLALAPQYLRRLVPGGHLILGGLLAEEAAPLAATLAEHGLTLKERTDVDGWASLLLGR